MPGPAAVMPKHGLTGATACRGGLGVAWGAPIRLRQDEMQLLGPAPMRRAGRIGRA